MAKEELIAGLLSEMRRGAMVFCVLAKLRRAAYGYSLVAQLAEAGVPIEANTLYPLLRRLEGQGLLESTWNTEDGAKPRKYYVATALGREVLLVLERHWRETIENINNILEE